VKFNKKIIIKEKRKKEKVIKNKRNREIKNKNWPAWITPVSASAKIEGKVFVMGVGVGEGLVMGRGMLFGAGTVLRELEVLLGVVAVSEGIGFITLDGGILLRMIWAGGPCGRVAGADSGDRMVASFSWGVHGEEGLRGSGCVSKEEEGVRKCSGVMALFPWWWGMSRSEEGGRRGPEGGVDSFLRGVLMRGGGGGASLGGFLLLIPSSPAREIQVDGKQIEDTHAGSNLNSSPFWEKKFSLSAFSFSLCSISFCFFFTSFVPFSFPIFPTGSLSLYVVCAKSLLRILNKSEKECLSSLYLEADFFKFEENKDKAEGEGKGYESGKRKEWERVTRSGEVSMPFALHLERVLRKPTAAIFLSVGATRMGKFL
jgi:hypothetical protein